MHIRKTAKQQRRFNLPFLRKKCLKNTASKPHIRIQAFFGYCSGISDIY